MNKVAIFDFDGTIVDTITDVALSFNAALKENGFGELLREYGRKHLHG